MTNFKKYSVNLCFFLAVAFGIVAPITVTYAQNTQLKIAVVDTQKVLRASLAKKQIDQTVVGNRNQFQQEFREKEQSLLTANQALVRQKSILAPEVYAQKKADIDKQAAIIRSAAKARKDSINKYRNAGLKQIESQLGVIIEQIVKANGYDLIIVKQSLVYTLNSLDITDQVIQQLNATLPSISIQ
ncbi:hypothetical protein A9Q97_01225 [Rhodospirillales bacterium 47_12_T64]|nr:hypothetical protein A9Q97_01225 [Rhodospirillales bacterium 47_12_T64]